MGFLDALGQYEFLQTALLAGLLASLGCGLIGTYVVVKRIGYLAGGISHTVLGGMGAALFFGFSPMLGALAVGVASALLIGWIKLNWQEQEDTLISALWAIGMAVGVIFIAKTPGYGTDMMSYLFGNILLIPPELIQQMVALDLLVLVAVALFYRQFLVVSFDEEFARLRGLPVTFFWLLLLCLVAVTVVLLVQVVGLVLVIALLTLPAAIAGHYVHSLGRMMWLSGVIGALLCGLGVMLSWELDLPAGATIILLAGSAYVLSTVVARLRRS